MDWSVVCPVCGGPGRVERDVLGNETIVCDAYVKCKPMTPLERLMARAEAEIESFWDNLTDEAA